MNTIRSKLIGKTEVYKRTIKHPKLGIIHCEETYVFGKLTNQVFKWPKPKHQGFEPHNMNFRYYGGKIDTYKVSQDYLNGSYAWYDRIQLIEDLKTFNDFNNLYCLWMQMDGNIYRLTDEYPLPIVTRVELWESRYDLDKAKKHLSKRKDVKNIHLQENCVQNWSISGRHDLVFDYYVPKDKMKQSVGKDNYNLDRMRHKFLGLDKFRKEEKEYESEDY